MKNNFLKRLTFRYLYLFRPRWDTGIPVPELVRFVSQNPAGNALDLGCGTGTNILYLAEHGWSVTGIDFISTVIRKAKKKLKGLPVTLLVEDVAQLKSLEIPGPYDLLLDVGCFHNLSFSEREKVVAGMRCWLKPGASIMIYAFQRMNDAQSKGISREDMIACFEEGFELINVEQGEGHPPSAWYYFRRK
jgi:SAM-dependent methyltransferase